MILVDTSVWIDHLHHSSLKLTQLLESEQVLTHPFVIGELASGNIQNRTEILTLLQQLPSSPTVDQKELLQFIDAHRLYGKGLGFVDVHLLASSRLDQVSLWTKDKRLQKKARELQSVQLID